MDKKLIEQIKNDLQIYRKKYLREDFLELDESATRIMTNFFLTNILGYEEIVDIKTEFRIKGEYADYVIQLEKEKKYVVEVKSIQIDLHEKHLKQALLYAANEGIDWIILLNGRQIQLYKVLFEKPIETKLIYSYNLLDPNEFKNCINNIAMLSKKATCKNTLDAYWKKFNTSSPKNLSKILYSETVVKFLKRELKSQTGVVFDDDEIADSLFKVIVEPIDFARPRLKKAVKKPKEEEANK